MDGVGVPINGGGGGGLKGGGGGGGIVLEGVLTNPGCTCLMSY